MRSTCSPRTAAPRSATSATTPRPSSTPSPRRSPRRRSARRSRSTATSRAPRRCSAPRSAISPTPRDDDEGWRSDYGSPLRDGAAMLTLASETRTRHRPRQPVEPRRAGARQRARYTSTQEDAWSLMAAHALMESLVAAEARRRRRAARRPALPRPRRREPRDRAARRSRTAATGRSRSASPCAASRRRRSRPAAISTRSTRSYYTLEGEPVDLAAVEQGARLVAVLDVTTTESQGARLVLDDPLPAGFEIDNPHVLVERRRGGARLAEPRRRTRRMWSSAPTASSRRGTCRPAARRSSSSPTSSAPCRPGTFMHPAALVEDMYRPERRARTDTGHGRGGRPAAVRRRTMRCCALPPPCGEVARRAAMRGRAWEGGSDARAQPPHPPSPPLAGRPSPQGGELARSASALRSLPSSPPASSRPPRRSR